MFVGSILCTGECGSPNKISLTITDATNAPAYRVALRSATNDWDSVYTVTGKAPSVIFVGNGSTVRYVRVVSVNTNNVESLFSGEVSVTVPATTTTNMVVGVNYMDQLLRTPAWPIKGIEILRNYPNPFDESTYVVLKNEAEQQFDEAYLTIRKGDGTLVEKRKIQIKPGLNEYLFDYKNDGRIEVFYYTLETDNQVIATNRMMMR